MSGNVYEWCLDWHVKNYYANNPSKNPKNTKRLDYLRVNRGGSYMFEAIYCRFADLHASKPDHTAKK